MAAAAAALGADQSYADSEHPNVVQLIFNGISVNSITAEGTVEVTAGQPYTLPLTIESTGSGSDTTWDITLDAGRSKSTAIAEDFINNSGGSGNVWAEGETFDDSPGQLNFFFGLTIQIFVGDVLTPPFTLYLGQGSTFDPFEENNWWVGSPSLGFSNSVIAANTFLDVGGTDLYFSAADTLDNSFELSFNPNIAGPIVPEPASGALLAVGFAALVAAALARRRSRQAANLV
jgi:hypothetical protein